MKKKVPPLIIERIEDQTNLHFLSIVEYNRNEYICIIDDITNTEVKAIILDINLAQKEISINDLISEAIEWYYSGSSIYQFSTHMAKKQLTHLITPLYRSFNINNISRVVGVPFDYRYLSKAKTKRKKVVAIQEGIEIRLKRLV